MKTFLRVAFFITGVVLLFITCGKNTKPSAENNMAWIIPEGTALVKPETFGNPNAENTITFWGFRNIGPNSPYEHTPKDIAERIESWALKNPDTKVDVQIEIPAEKANEFLVKLYEAAKAGTAPSIAHVDSFFLPKLLDKTADFKQMPQPLEPYLTEAELANYYDGYRDFCTDEDGHLIGHFVSTDLRALWYRKDLIPNPPKTWDELITIAKRLKAEGKISEGLLTQVGRHENTFFYFLSIFWSAGGKLVDEQGNPVFGEGKNREIMLDCLKLYKRLVDEGVMPSRTANISAYTDLNAAVKMSMPAFIINGGWIESSLPQLIGDEEFAKYGMTPIPVLKTDQQPTSGAGGWTAVIFEQDPKLRAKAANFLWHVYGSAEGAASTIEAGLPTARKMRENWNYQPPLSSTKRGLLDFLQYARLRPGAPVYSDISLAMQVAMGEVVLGTKTPEEALNNAWEEVLSIK
jgi:multiple sugar transport system substrate-binding protein